MLVCSALMKSKFMTSYRERILNVGSFSSDEIEVYDIIYGVNTKCWFVKH
jgi:hypothetical protein